MQRALTDQEIADAFARIDHAQHEINLARAFLLSLTNAVPSPASSDPIATINDWISPGRAAQIVGKSKVTIRRWCEANPIDGERGYGFFCGGWNISEGRFRAAIAAEHQRKKIARTR